MKKNIKPMGIILGTVVIMTAVFIGIKSFNNKDGDARKIEALIQDDLHADPHVADDGIVISCCSELKDSYEATSEEKFVDTDFLYYEQESYPDAMDVKAELIRNKVDYICTTSINLPEEYDALLGIRLLGRTEVYAVYRVLANRYSNIDDEVTVGKITDAMGLKVRDIYISLSGGDTAVKDAAPEDVIATYLVLNDLHTQSTKDDTTAEFAETIDGRFTELLRTETGMGAEDAWQNISAVIDTYDVDGILMAGDMVDFASSTNYELFGLGLQKIKTPILYTRADHDVSAWYNSDGTYTNEDGWKAHNNFSSVAGPVSNDEILVWEAEDYILLGWNNSCYQMNPTGLEVAKEVFSKGKPVILVTHVPLDTGDDGLYESSIGVYDGVHAKLWGGRNCLYQPDDTTQQFLGMCLSEDTPLSAIVCGHLHYQYDARLNDEVTEYVLAPSYLGNMCRINICK